MGGSTTTGFLKPSIDDIFGSSWKEDRGDLDSLKETTFIYNPSSALPIPVQKHRLPISKNRDQILFLLEQNQVLVVVGDTGCGKSTQIPQFLVPCLDPNKMIGVTEPRRVAVTTLASRVSEEMGSPLGRTVGYNIRLDECFDRSVTKIKYMTEGILIREMMGDPLLRDYSVIMVDEAHERTTNVDILMGLLKKILRKRNDLKLIVSSATIDAEYIRDFFSDKSGAHESKSAILSVEGRSYSIESQYLKEPCPNYVKCCAETVLKIHEREPPGDVLVFLTGMDEVDECVTLLKEHTRESGPNKHGLKIWPVPMYGALSPHDQLKVFRPSTRGTRKVVVATNIAETSITIEGISHVVDSCFVKLKWFNPETTIDSLIVTEISKASALQRAGRAGRTRPGKCYRLCTKEAFSKLQLNTPPEMQRTDLSLPVLQLKALGIENIVRFEFPSAPPAKNLIASMELLYALGAIDDRGLLTVPLGEQMSEFAVHPTLSKILLTSGQYNCCEEIAAIVAMLQVENVFTQAPVGQSGKSRAARRKFEVKEGDLLTLLNVYSGYKRQEGDCRQWCSDNFLKVKALRRADQLYDSLIKTLSRYKVFKPKSSAHTDLLTAADSAKKTDDIRKCLVSGLFPNAAYLHMSGTYRTVRGDHQLSVHPTSVVYTMSPQPGWIIFNEMVHTNKVFIKDITVIDPLWLEILAPHYYEKVTLRT